MPRLFCFIRTVCTAVAIAGLPGISASGVAQEVGAQSTPDPKPAARLELTPAQRELIYASLSKQTYRSTAAPPTFAAAIGAIVPEPVQLAPLPETVTDVVPQARGYAGAFVANEALIVEPKARQIVEVITRP